MGLRNIVIHGYAEIDNETVWRTATEYVPGLAAEIIAQLEDADHTRSDN